MCDLDSDIAGSSKDIQQIEPKANTQLSSTERPVCGEKEKIEDCSKFDRDTLNREKHDEVTDPTSAGRPVCGHESTKRCVLTPKHVENDQTRKERPVSGQQFTQLEEIDIDLKVPGLSHAVVKQSENFCDRELVKKIESHPHREALQADLQQNNVYSPFSDESKAMILELGTVELFELCEIFTNVQCSECLL